MANVFVVGTGRSGTHSLSALFATLSNACSLHEGRHYDGSTGLYSHHWARQWLPRIYPTRRNLRYRDVGQLLSLNIHLYHLARDKAESFQETVDLTGESLRIMDESFASRHLLIKTCERLGLHFCEANRVYYNYLTYMHRRYPDAKFVHLTRSPYRTVPSWAARPAAYPDGFDLNFRVGDRCTVRSMNRRRMVNWVGEKPLPFDDPWHDRWKTMSRLEKIAWFWGYVNDNIESRLANVPPENKMTLRIEDLGADDMVPRLLHFLDLEDDWESEVLSEHDKNPNVRAVDEEVLHACNEVIGEDAIQRFGYEPIRTEFR